jgi:hypothetical protein
MTIDLTLRRLACDLVLKAKKLPKIDWKQEVIDTQKGLERIGFVDILAGQEVEPEHVEIHLRSLGFCDITKFERARENSFYFLKRLSQSKRKMREWTFVDRSSQDYLLFAFSNPEDGVWFKMKFL